MLPKVEIKHIDPECLKQEGAVGAYLISLVDVLNLIGELPVTRLIINRFSMEGELYEIEATVKSDIISLDIQGNVKESNG